MQISKYVLAASAAENFNWPVWQEIYYLSRRLQDNFCLQPH